MQSSTFDESAILDSEYTGDLNTRLTPIPEGEYSAHVHGIKVRQIETKNGPATLADFTFVIDDEDVKRQTQLTEPQARLSIFLDLNAQGQLMTAEENANANVRLGRLKDALGLKAGRKWSLRHMDGLSCFVKIKHRTDPNDIEVTYSEVAGVSKSKSDQRAAA